MYLKALEMQGFKSFPDKTVLTFGKGVTAVVGPNGSGKSNISDAVRWVLGEQSTKSLRGAKMEDVIFSGTGERRPQGFAEVTLRLDNTDGALNSPEPEVAVTRRYYRSGDSAYIINGKTVRLKDVNELFMDTGLGRDGYSMVGQGKIEEMVSAKSDNRRDMFEEAAGISHYRYRRAEALKRLTQTEENLVRLRDIVTELEGRIGPLERQSKKAQQFLVYAAERKELEIGLWLELMKRGAEQIRELRGKLGVAQSQYDIAGQVLQKLSADIEQAAENTRLINVRAEEKRGENSRFEEQASALEAQAAVLDNSIVHNNETADRIRRDIDLQSDAQTEIDEEEKEIKKRISELAGTIDESEKKLTELTSLLTGLDSRNDEYSDEYNSLNAVISALSLKISQLDIMISSSAASAKELSARAETVKKLIEEKEHEHSRLADENEKAKAAYDAACASLSEKNNMSAGISIRLQKAEKRAEERKAEYENEKLRLMQINSRLKFLQDTEKSMDGYQGSVKAVMREKERGTLRGIHGTVFQLISVEEQYRTAIETALGNAIQDIITDNENDAKRAINHLKETGGGRATFMPISAVKGRVLEEKGLDDCFGFVSIAHELVECDGIYREIIKSLLGRIAVCEDLDCAITLAKKYSYKFKIVTLDGQVINAGGAMTGGSKINSAGFLARKTEAEKLSREVTSVQQKLDGLTKSMKEANEALSKEKADLDGLRGDIMRANEECAAARSRLSLASGRLTDSENAAAELSKELDEAGQKIAYFEESVRVAEKERETLNNEKNTKEEKARELTGGKDSLAARREEINAGMSEVNLGMVAAVKETQAEKEKLEALSARRASLGTRSGELNAELEDLEKKNAELKDSADKTRASAALLRSSISKNAEEIKELFKERDECEKTSSDARNLEREKNEEREKLNGEIIRLDERRRFLEKEQEDTEKRLFDEYALTKREAAESAAEIESVPKAQKRLGELKGLIKALGSVNVAAIEEYKEVSSRYEFLSGQVDDVETSRKELLKMIDELTGQMAERFRERFDAINGFFKETYISLFGGGTAELVLEDENDILNCGIDIKAQPPGKNVKSLSLLSGGEKGLTAIALLFAILKVRPAPFCIFDEVEAALDDVNVLRYAQYVRMMTGDIQFILITHRRGTMEEADVLYGVTMQEHGVSKLLELKTAEMVRELKLDE